MTRLRFILYFSFGLLAFVVYFLVMFIILMKLFNPALKQEFIYYTERAWLDISIFAFCFISGSFLFSLLFVSPLSSIIASIHRLSARDYLAGSDTPAKKRRSYFIYREVINNIEALAANLNQAEHERARLETVKKEWIAGVSHDLKTPLSYITGYSSLLLNEDHTFSRQEQQRFLHEIYRKGVYIGELVQDLNLWFYLDNTDLSLLMSREPFDLVTFLQHTLADAANDPRASRYDFSFHTELPRLYVRLDKRLVYRAVYNVLVNALEHNPDGTAISLSLVSQEEGIARIDIADTGIGIDEETAASLFDRYSGGTKSPGKKLGLYIAKSIVAAHLGDIAVVSRPGKGSVFQITLPV